jgi:hypothetical protein
MPAMAPIDRFEEDAFKGVEDASDDVLVEVAGVDEAKDVDDEVNAAVVVEVPVVEVPVPFPSPVGLRFTYAAQSGLGSARGQLLA